MKTEEPEYVAKTLSWCNTIRAIKGMEPLEKLPKGSRWNGDSCPCGKATGVFVDRYRWAETAELATTGRVVRKLPWDVSTFVDAFDKGLLPQYDENIPSDED